MPPCEDVKLEDRDVIIDSDVNGGLEGHGLQGGVDGVDLVQRRAEHPPGDDGPMVCAYVHNHYQ